MSGTLRSGIAGEGLTWREKLLVGCRRTGLHVPQVQSQTKPEAGQPACVQRRRPQQVRRRPTDAIDAQQAGISREHIMGVKGSKRLMCTDAGQAGLTATPSGTQPLEYLCKTHVQCQVRVVEDLSRLTFEALQRDWRYVQPLFLWDALNPLHIAVAPASQLKGVLRAVLGLTSGCMLQQKRGHGGDLRVLTVHTCPDHWRR